MQISVNYLVKTSFLLALIGFQSLEANDDSFEVNVPRLNEAPKIDGVLDEDVWKRAGSFSNFTQVEPESFGPGGNMSSRSFGSKPGWNSSIMLLADRMVCCADGYALSSSSM